MYAPRMWFWWAVVIVCASGALEMLDAFEYAGRLPARYGVYVACAAAMPLALLMRDDAATMIPMIILAGSILTLFTRQSAALMDAAAPLFVAFSTIIPAVLLLMIDLTPRVGHLLVLLAFAIPLMGDIFALFLGRAFGRHKLTQLSPKKTIEGAVGGMLGSVVGSLLFCRVGTLMFGLVAPAIPMGHLAALGIAGGLMGQLGDLSSSLVKRHTGVKDFGALFPGHGGIMDRLDSVLFAVYAVYAYSRVVLR